MIKKSLTCGVLLLSLPFLVVSCADLRDADRCYRIARLTCEKSCDVPDTEKCIETQKKLCHDTDEEQLDGTRLDECSNKLAELDDCAGRKAVVAACADPGDQVGATCSSGSECPEGLSCLSGMCTSSCFYDDGCKGYISASGGPTYCNGMNDNSGVCIGVCQSNAECSKGWVCQANGSVRTCGPNTGTVPDPPGQGAKLGDPCDSTADCASSQCTLGYCSKSCSSQTDCSGLTSDGGALSCVRVTGSLATACFPSCTTASDCAFGSECKPQTTSDGSSRSVCFDDSTMPPVTGKRLFGESCDAASECSEAGARCETFCTENCTNDSQCSVMTSTGLAGRCASDAVPGSTLCLPGCTPGVSGQCALGSSCDAVQLPSGFAYLCRPGAGSEVRRGLVGDPCKVSEDCNETVGLSCAFGMCSKSCTGGSPCPDTSGAKEPICAGIISNFPEIVGCTYTCENQDCLPGWQCGYDRSVNRDVCMHPPQ